MKPRTKKVSSPSLPSPARADCRALTLTRRASIALGLLPDFEPVTNLQAVVLDIGLRHPWPAYLRHSGNEDARVVVRLYDELAKQEREAVTLDHYIAAGKVAIRDKVGKVTGDRPVDFHAVFGALSEQVSRIEGAAAQMMAAVRGPAMVKAAEMWGGMPDGHADRKLLLQTAGVAPVPKNQITNVSVRDGGVLDARQQVAIGQINVHIPTLEEVVRDVDAALDRVDARDIPEGANLTTGMPSMPEGGN